MQALRYFLPGTPQGKGRPRACVTSGGKVRVFTPAKTRDYEASVQAHAMRCMALAGWKLGASTDRYAVRLDLYFADARVSDLDNVSKIVLDALNGVVWVDDRQVCSLTVHRMLRCANPGVDVMIDLTEEVFE